MEICYLCFPSCWKLVDLSNWKGEKVKIGIDPWVGRKGRHQIPFWMIHELRNEGNFNLR